MLTHHRDRVTRPLLAVLAASLGVLSSGCGDTSGLGRRYAVSGKVTYKGAPVKKAVINFVPATAEGRGPSGQVKDGSYSLTTQDPGDGAFPGTYKVTVDDRQLDEAKLKEQAAALARESNMKPSSAISPLVQAEAMKNAKGVVPGKYQIAETSDIEVEVKPQSNTIDIDLKD